MEVSAAIRVSMYKVRFLAPFRVLSPKAFGEIYLCGDKDRDSMG